MANKGVWIVFAINLPTGETQVIKNEPQTSAQFIVGKIEWDFKTAIIYKI